MNEWTSIVPMHAETVTCSSRSLTKNIYAWISEAWGSAEAGFGVRGSVQELTGFMQ